MCFKLKMLVPMIRGNQFLMLFEDIYSVYIERGEVDYKGKKEPLNDDWLD